MSNSTIGCITANADVSGVGVRTAIYLQAFLALVRPMISASDNVITRIEAEDIVEQSTTVLVTAFALLVATVVQAHILEGLSFHHALIVLNLSWINNLTVLLVPFFTMAHRGDLLAYDVAENKVLEYADALGDCFARQRAMVRASTRINKKSMYATIGGPGYALASLHLLAVGGVGLWVWGTNSNPRWGGAACKAETVAVIFSHDVAASSPALRRFSIFAYAILATPFLNILFLIGGFSISSVSPIIVGSVVLRILTHCIPRQGDPESRPTSFGNSTRRECRGFWPSVRHLFRRPFVSNPFVVIAVTSAILVSVLVVDTELMIRRNSHLRQREGGWTFGQVLALAVMITPCLGAIKFTISALPDRLRDKLPFVHSDHSDRRVAEIQMSLISLTTACEDLTIGWDWFEYDEQRVQQPIGDIRKRTLDLLTSLSASSKDRSYVVSLLKSKLREGYNDRRLAERLGVNIKARDNWIGMAALSAIPGGMGATDGTAVTTTNRRILEGLGVPPAKDWLRAMYEASANWAEQFGDKDDMDAAVKAANELLQLLPDEDPEKKSVLCDLASYLKLRYERLADVSDVTASIETYQRALKLTFDGHPHKLVALDGLGDSFRLRFERFGESSDILAAITSHGRAIDLTPEGHCEIRGRLKSLATDLRLRFQRFGDPDDLTATITALQQVLDLSPDSYPTTHQQLNDIGKLFQLRFERLGNVEDIAAAIAAHQRVIDGTPYWRRRKRAEVDDVQDDFSSAVAAYRRAVELIPDVHPDKSAYLDRFNSTLNQLDDPHRHTSNPFEYSSN